MAGENYNNEGNYIIVEEWQTLDDFEVCYQNSENQLQQELIENGQLLNPIQAVEEAIDEARSYEDTGAPDDESLAVIQSEQMFEKTMNSSGLALVTEVVLTPTPLTAVSPPNQEREAPVVIVLEKKLMGEITHELEHLEVTSCYEATAVPKSLSFKLPKKYHDKIGLGSEELQPAQDNSNSSIGKGGDSKTIFSWSKSITFQLPEEIHRSIQKMDETLPATSDTLSLAERLQGWKIRQKTGDGRSDKFFHHKKSRRMFRSFLEAETYIVYSGRKQHLSKKRKLNEAPKKEQSQVEHKPLSVPDYIQEEEVQVPTKEMIEKFHRDAWNNLLNMQWPYHLW